VKNIVCVLLLLPAVALGACGRSANSAENGNSAEKEPALTQPQSGAIDQPTLEQWYGVYASPKEVAGFTGTVLALEKGKSSVVEYRKLFYSDAGPTGKDGDPYERGECTTSGSSLHMASGKLTDSYTLARIQGHVVLMRTDAWGMYQKSGKLYDYGIFIKVEAGADPALRLETVTHPSIKLLYSDPSKPWQDPFVHGPNDG